MRTEPGYENRKAGACEPFTLMVKPAGSACNMRCEYCYYLHTSGSNASGRMKPDLLRSLLGQYFSASSLPEVTVTWHGGEPMLTGLDFYREAVRLEQQLLPPGMACRNNLQTNGLLLDDAWCEFLAENGFDVGVSIDGPALVHDRYRKDAAGQGTFDRVVRSIRLLQSHGIQPDLLCTVTPETAENGDLVYRTLRDLGTGWMQFIPIVRRDGEGGITADSVSPTQYGEFLKDVFSQWLFHDLDRTEVQLFSETARVLNGQEASLCWMRETCGRVPVVEKDGSVFSCDHFVRPDFRLGSTEENSLQALMSSSRQERFGNAKRDSLTAECRACPWLFLCHGGCPKDRFARSPGGEEGQYYLCEGLKSFFAYAVPRLRQAMRLSAARKSRQDIMEALVRAERESVRGLSRNDLCPCGSGKKYKQCCQKRCP
ncbi:MAG: anaerobic sulfatase maturase [Clostridia bacterium]|nr:anaerobic sulfatase maturase [Clostridia bacterium]